MSQELVTNENGTSFSESRKVSSKLCVEVSRIDPFALPSVPLVERGDLPDVPGIYFVIQCQSATILYVGKSVCIRQRWHSHHKLGELQSYNDVLVSWLVYPAQSDDDLIELEQACIAYFTPLLNYGSKVLKPDPAEMLVQALSQTQYVDFIHVASEQRKKINQGVTLPGSLFTLYKDAAYQLTRKGDKTTMGDLMALYLVESFVEKILPRLEGKK